jgi:aspartate kinase
VGDAQKLHAVSYEEMLEMAASGAKVLQLRSVEFARNHGVKVHVRSTFTDEPGTWIREEDERMLEKALISGVTHTVDEVVYEVDGVRPAELFEALAAAEVNVDTIIQMDSRIVFSAPAEDRRQVEQALGELGARFTEQQGLGKVSIVGAGMKSHPGVAAKTFATLRELSLEPKFVATSPIQIAFYVPRGSVHETVKALHTVFDLSSPAAERHHG